MFHAFAQRIRPHRAWSYLALEAPRPMVAVALALLAALGVLALTRSNPAMTESARVRDTFAPFISGLITAATMAVGFATLSLRRGMKGIGELRDHMRADREYAERVEALIGRDAPVAVGPALVALLDAASHRARELGGVELADHLEGVSARVRDANGSPERLLLASLELDAESALHAARTHLRDERLAELIETANVGRSYVKTLGMQWGLSRMSQGIALTSIVAVVVAALLVLSYERGPFAAYAVSGAMFAVLLPLAVFVSYAIRFTFVNQHTLPIGHFVFGPENPRLAQGSHHAHQR